MSAKSFYTAFSQVTASIPFNENFNNGTGYLDNCQEGEHAPIVAPGQIVKTETLKGRKILIVGTRFGNAVIFERYTNAIAEDTNVIVGNLPKEVEQLYLGSAVGTNLAQDNITLFLLLGEPKYASIHPNVGERIENLFAAPAKKEARDARKAAMMAEA